MKRAALLVGCFWLFASPVFATNEFSKEWKLSYAGDDAPAEFVSAVRKAGCNVCHVKGGKKEERNEYGRSLKEFLNKEDYSKEKLAANPELAKEIIAGFKKAGEKKSADGKAFAAKIKAGELPATDAGL